VDFLQEALKNKEIHEVPLNLKKPWKEGGLKNRRAICFYSKQALITIKDILLEISMGTEEKSMTNRGRKRICGVLHRI